MRRLLRPSETVAAFVASAWLLAGCSLTSGYPTDPEPNTTLPALSNKYFGPTADDGYNALKPASPDYATSRRAMRDEIVYARVHVYDMEFSEFQRSLNATGNDVSVGSDLTALVLNGIGATTGNAGTKTMMAAASGGVIGAQGDINKDLYYQKTLPAIIAQMEANRAKVKLSIFTNLKQPDADYPLPRAESDLADLSDAGSLPNAINNITQQATTQKNAADSEIQTTQALTYVSTDSAQKVADWLYPNGKLDATHNTALQNWLNAQPELFLNGANYPTAALAIGDDPKNDLEPIRKRALADPTLGIPN